MIGDCFECPLALTRKRQVKPRGGFRRRVMFIGEAPGADEESQGKAFVGASGKMLNQWIDTLGLSEDDVYITNVVKCRPPGNRDPTDFEIQGCIPHLAREIQELKPELIVPLGRFAKDVVSHLRDDGLITAQQYGVALRHPAWYLRKGGRPTEELQYIRRRLENEENNIRGREV